MTDLLIRHARVDDIDVLCRLGATTFRETYRSISDPREVIKDVLPRPLEDVPGITTEVRRVEDNQQQTQTPVNEQVNRAPPPTTK